MLALSPEPLTIVVLSLSITILEADPRSSGVTLSNVLPSSSLITWPPVKIAISSSIAFLLSPKPGALTAAMFSIPLNLFTTSVANASPSISSAMIRRGRLDFWTCSKTGRRSFKFDTFLSYSSTNGFSKTASIFSVSVAK